MTASSMLKVRALISPAALQSALAEVVEWAKTIDFAYAWMSSGEDGRGFWNTLNDEKIGRGIVGLQFLGTEPFVLRHFLHNALGRVHVLAERQGTFHPKILLASKGNQRRAILGSSNFTAGGFVRNTELNVLLEGRANEAVFQELEQTLSEYWERSQPITNSVIERYQRAWARRVRPKPFSLSPSSIGTELNLSWSAYYRRLSQAGEDWQKRAGGEVTYLSELSIVRRVFRSGKRFGELPYEDARIVAGFGPRVGWFGSTGAARSFMHLVKDHRRKIGPLIDPIPLKGDVPDSVVRGVFRAAQCLDQVGIACVTRLLVVKRPDQFYSVNSKNRARMRDELGIAPKNGEQYLALLGQIRQLEWCRAPRPRGASKEERQMWNARVALLDMLFYESDA